MPDSFTQVLSIFDQVPCNFSQVPDSFALCRLTKKGKARVRTASPYWSTAKLRNIFAKSKSAIFHFNILEAARNSKIESHSKVRATELALIAEPQPDLCKNCAFHFALLSPFTNFT